MDVRLIIEGNLFKATLDYFIDQDHPGNVMYVYRTKVFTQTSE